MPFSPSLFLFSFFSFAFFFKLSLRKSNWYNSEGRDLGVCVWCLKFVTRTNYSKKNVCLTWDWYPSRGHIGMWVVGLEIPTESLSGAGWGQEAGNMGERLTFLGGRQEVVAAREGDAEVVVLGETVALEHVWPGEAEGGHDWSAAVLHLHAERVARLDGFVQVIEADRGEERAQELLGVWVALLHDQRDPGARLLQHLLHGLVAQQVGQPHVLVLYAVAQLQVGRDGLAVAALVGEVGLAEEEPARGAQAAVRGEDEQQQRARALRHRGRATPGGRRAEPGKREAAGAEFVPARSLCSGRFGGPGKRAAETPGARRTVRARSSPLGFALQARAQLRGAPTRGSRVSHCWGPARVFLAFFMQIWRWGGGKKGRSQCRVIRGGLVTTL